MISPPPPAKRARVDDPALAVGNAVLALGSTVPLLQRLIASQSVNPDQ